MILEVSEGVQEIIDSKHLWNASWRLAEISNAIHNAFVDKDNGVNTKQLQTDQEALKLFQQKTHKRSWEIN